MLPGVRLYQGVLNRTIPNYALIAARDFVDRDEGSAGLGFVGRLDGLNDGLWCQSSMNVNNIGSWKLPNGNAVSDDLEFDPVHMAKGPGQVGLLRSIGIGSSPYQGMYICTIPDEKGVNQTLVVWAAGNNASDGTSGKREFNISMNDFSLSFSLIRVYERTPEDTQHCVGSLFAFFHLCLVSVPFLGPSLTEMKFYRHFSP